MWMYVLHVSACIQQFHGVDVVGYICGCMYDVYVPVFNSPMM